MGFAFEPKKVKIRALHDDVIVSDMEFGEMKTAGGIVLRSDNGQSHGVKPRWGKVYKVGPKHTEIKVGQWILVEHGRWTRKLEINDGEGVKSLQKVEVKSIMAVSDEAPSAADVVIGNSI